MNAFHCFCFAPSFENASVSANEDCLGEGRAPLLERRLERASAGMAPSKAKFCERNQMSKKSFIRLFAMPRSTIAEPHVDLGSEPRDAEGAGERHAHAFVLCVLPYPRGLHAFRVEEHRVVLDLGGWIDTAF
ncbi:hypothetical protein AKJ09_04589 [Labilithrix luteola]|uniref:Uncharacterized protein n=2 Tax=Labilithrix luteola TaxID=1391654 RepID=A0A0K1PWL8_9BACT|nr:hypothetical protein AKJ09_04589 [Labilithrix luteola]